MKSVVNKNAFTIIELLVAMALLAMMLGLSGVIFSTTVKAYRTAGASIEVSRNLRAVTGQLNSDFRGLRKDAPLFFWFDFIPFDTDLDGTVDYYRSFDAMHFFADGDFQTTKQYQYDSDNNGTIDATEPSKTLYSDIARVYYGHAFSRSVAVNFTEGLLARRCHLLTTDPVAQIPNFAFPIDYTALTAPATNFGAYENTREYNTLTLTDWLNIFGNGSANSNYFLLKVFFDNPNPTNGNLSRPFIDVPMTSGFPDGLWNLLAQGVLQMQVQWAYTSDDLSVAGAFTGVRWWPSRDPNGDGNYADSDFGGTGVNTPQFGVYFQVPVGSTPTLGNWKSAAACRTSGTFFRSDFYPAALRFTFILRDSNGLFKDGKTFTHIVYLDN